MARREGIFSRIFRALFPRREPEPESLRERGRDIPEPPTLGRGTPSRFFGTPVYHADTDSWDGITDRDWRRISNIADRQINNGASFNADIGVDWRGLFRTGDKEEELLAIIEALESGIIDADDMIDLLHYRERAATATARQQDTSMGSAFWNSRIQGLPEELYWYQWGW